MSPAAAAAAATGIPIGGDVRGIRPLPTTWRECLRAWQGGELCSDPVLRQALETFMRPGEWR
jgi:hypothetical protein